ncbi:MFS transporter [Trinickia caryophylli]|nr:MFS transporter [Trinickia caryophylli]
MKDVLAASLVNGLALFDFIVFGFFAAMLGDRLFPFTAPMSAPLLVAATLGAGLLAQPLGGIFVGAYAERRGRQRAVLLGGGLATAGTAMLVLSPSHAQVGLAAPAIAVVARLLQGIGLGGVGGPVAALLMEAAPQRRRALLLGCRLAGNGLAPLLGASLSLLMTHLLTPAQLFAWGWRAAFAAGLPLIGAACYLGRRQPTPGSPGQVANPLAPMWRAHRGTVFKGALLMGFPAVPLYTLVHIMPAYIAAPARGLGSMTSLAASALSGSLLIVLGPLSGLAVDALPRRKPLLLASIAGAALGVYALFRWMPGADPTAWLFASIGLITALSALGSCAATVLVLEALPRELRACGYGAAYALGSALFGSTAGFIVTALMKWTATPMSMAWNAILCCMLGACAAIALEERAPAAAR